jgi:hypothetical protein
MDPTIILTPFLASANFRVWFFFKNNGKKNQKNKEKKRKFFPILSSQTKIFNLSHIRWEQKACEDDALLLIYKCDKKNKRKHIVTRLTPCLTTWVSLQV